MHTIPETHYRTHHTAHMVSRMIVSPEAPLGMAYWVSPPQHELCKHAACRPYIYASVVAHRAEEELRCTIPACKHLGEEEEKDSRANRRIRIQHIVRTVLCLRVCVRSNSTSQVMQAALGTPETLSLMYAPPPPQKQTGMGAHTGNPLPWGCSWGWDCRMCATDRSR